MTGQKVRVVVGDDHPMFRDGVVRALVSSGQIEVVAEADDGLTALEAIRAHTPQVALLDYRMPGMDGSEVPAAVMRDELATRVLLISAHDESAIVYQALQIGAAGFLPKESTRSELVNAVLDCAKGRDVIAPSLAAGLAGEIRKRAEPDAPTLSPREREVLRLIAAGTSIPAMAKELFLAPSTVKTHVRRLPGVYAVVLGGWAVAAVVWIVVVLRGPVPRWADWASTGIDVLVIVVLCLVSGGATAALLPVFFLLPIAVAFQDRPMLTAILGVATALGYLAAWIAYSRRDDTVGLPNVVYTQFGFLLWSAAAITALCMVLVRRQARVHKLQDVRRQLVSEAMQADERHNREVAEHLHDGPLQTLLAARLDLDEVRERCDDPALASVHEALQQTAAALRSTVTELHPQVLAQLGLTPAIRERVRQFESRSGDRIVLTVADDGVGFDPATVEQYVAAGHIGLGSLLARFDAMGGSLRIDSTPGSGTTVTVTVTAPRA